MPSGVLDDRVRLILLSFLMLFVELALIRWTGSNVVYLSYFSNFILLASFLGIGIGFIVGTRPPDLFRWSPIALALFVGFVAAAGVRLDRSGSDLVFFGTLEATGLPMWVVLPVVFVSVAAIMAMVGQGVARTFVRFAPLEAYRLDITGSLLGIVGFAFLSFTGAPPVVWGAVIAVLLLLLVRGGWPALRIVAMAGLLIVLGRESLAPFNSWSPYYKVQVVRDPRVSDAFHISVNGIPHQSMASVAVRRVNDPVYWVPYERNASGRLDDVLVVGAGSGTDVAIALAEGAHRVDAVEIDPRIQQLGGQLHPDRPYADPRVTVHIDDGRAFLERTSRRYDLILFALPDSLTLVSGQSSVRLESYLFTQEAMEAAKAHLKPGGVFAMYNLYREDWLIGRLARTLHEAYGHPPCFDTVGDVGKLAVLTIGSSPAATRCEPSVAASIPSGPAPVSDDYPFLYLRERGIPALYLAAIGLILATSLAAIRFTGISLAATRGNVDLFLMGAAFLLLETKSVVQFALLFGTTWFVNTLVFGGILLMVLIAIHVAKRITVPSALVYCLLVVAVLAGWLVAPHSLLGLSTLPRAAASIALYFSPIFLANLVFAQRFKHVSQSNVAFGANLLGAMVGGLVEYLALVTGYQALAMLVAVLYVAAFAAGELRLGALRRATSTAPA